MKLFELFTGKKKPQVPDFSQAPAPEYKPDPITHAAQAEESKYILGIISAEVLEAEMRPLVESAGRRVDRLDEAVFHE